MKRDIVCWYGTSYGPGECGTRYSITNSGKRSKGEAEGRSEGRAVTLLGHTLAGMADEGGPVLDQPLAPLIPSGEQALPASMPAPPSKLKLFLMIPKVKMGLIIAGSVIAVLLLITALAFGVCYRGPVKMDFDPESDVAVTDVSTSGGSEEGFAKAHVVSASRRWNVGVATFSF